VYSAGSAPFRVAQEATATPRASGRLLLARATMGEHELLLDPAIRDWVLIPIVVIMFLMGLLRNNVTKMMRKDTAPKREQIKINNQLMRCRRLRANGHFLPPHAFYARKGFFCEKEKGVLMVKQVPSPLLASSSAQASSCAAASTAAASCAAALSRRPRPSRPDERSSPRAWPPANPNPNPNPNPYPNPNPDPHQAAPDPMAMMNDPSVMMNMMQGNFAMMVPQMVMMGTPSPPPSPQP
jgi:hypothetical protein